MGFRTRRRAAGICIGGNSCAASRSHVSATSSMVLLEKLSVMPSALDRVSPACLRYLAAQSTCDCFIAGLLLLLHAGNPNPNFAPPPFSHTSRLRRVAGRGGREMEAAPGVAAECDRCQTCERRRGHPTCPAARDRRAGYSRNNNTTWRAIVAATAATKAPSAIPQEPWSLPGTRRSAPLSDVRSIRVACRQANAAAPKAMAVGSIVTSHMPFSIHHRHVIAGEKPAAKPSAEAA